MAARKPKEIPGDDGRTVVDMNVDGMPWYVPREKADPEGENGIHYRMTKEELRAIVVGPFIVMVEEAELRLVEVVEAGAHVDEAIFVRDFGAGVAVDEIGIGAFDLVAVNQRDILPSAFVQQCVERCDVEGKLWS